MPKLGYCVLDAIERIDKVGAVHSERRAEICGRLDSAKEYLCGEKLKLTKLLENGAPADDSAKKTIAIQSGKVSLYYRRII